MLDDIKGKNAENMALITMVLDEVSGLYASQGTCRAYELERLESTLVTSLYMLNERIVDINVLVDKMLEKEVRGGLNRWIYRYLWQVAQRVKLGKINLQVG